MSKFKVGDTIRCIDKGNTSYLQLGKTYTVLRIGVSGWPDVEVFNNIEMVIVAYNPNHFELVYDTEKYVVLLLKSKSQLFKDRCPLVLESVKDDGIHGCFLSSEEEAGKLLKNIQKAFPENTYCVAKVNYQSIPEKELVEFNGEMYDKQQLEQALKLIKPVEKK